MSTLVLVHPRLRDRLNNEVDVTGHRIHVRPERDVHLLGMFKLTHDGSRLAEERPHLFRLGRGQVSDVNDMPLWPDDQGSDSERANGVIYVPVLGLTDASARRTSGLEEVARQAIAHVMSVPAPCTRGCRASRKVRRALRCAVPCRGS